MSIQFYNTLTEQKEPFTPLQPPRVGLYVCGVTVYDYCHLGHGRTYVAFDVLTRFLRASGYQVTLVKNFTDVDDKIIRRAAELGITPQALSERFMAEHDTDMQALGIAPADITPKVTTHMSQIIAMIERLVAQGFAYVSGSNMPAQDVYFEVARFPGYLKLSGRKAEDLLAGARVEINEIKRAPQDFALWKGAKAAEPFWPSPWGNGRPGWHIECSAMALAHLGPQFDIHGGGSDLVFPHHDNEIAQSEAANGVPFARYWLHSGMLNINEEKMSKSLGNFLTLRDVLSTHAPEALRLLFLSAHYRSALSFDLEQLEQSERRLNSAYRTLSQAVQAAQSLTAQGLQSAAAAPSEVEAMEKQFTAAMSDDLNTPEALGALYPALTRLAEWTAAAAGPSAAADTLTALTHWLAAIGRCAAVLGVLDVERAESYQAARRQQLLTRYQIDVPAVERLIEARQSARARKDFAESDRLRDQLLAMRIVLKDQGKTTTWQPQNEF